MRLMSSGCQILILLSKYFAGIKNHFDTDHFWYDFPFQRYDKNKLDMLEFSEFKNPCFSNWKFHFVSEVYEASKQHSIETNFSGHILTPLRYLSWRICAKGHLRPSRIWQILTFCTFVNLIQNSFNCWHPPHLLMLSHISVNRGMLLSRFFLVVTKCDIPPCTYFIWILFCYLYRFWGNILLPTRTEEL